MNKTVFMQKLKSGLRHLPKADREDAILYYEEYFAEMGAGENEDVTMELGRPEQIVKDIITECTKKHIDEQDKRTGMKSSATTIWMVILTVFASPLAIPVAGLLAGVIITIVAMVFAAVAVIFAFALAAIATGIGAIFAIASAVSIWQGILFVGIALTGIGIGILVMLACGKLAVLAVRAIAAVCKKAFLKKKAKEEA